MTQYKKLKYKNGKIYKIVNHKSKKIYYGSTCADLPTRLRQHEIAKNLHECESDKVMTKRGEYSIHLVEKFPCQNKKQLHQRERYHIERTTNVNKRRPLM